MNDIKAEPKNCYHMSAFMLSMSTLSTHDCVDKGLNVLLLGVQTKPNRTHHDRKAGIHRNSNTISNHIPIAFHK